MIVSQLFFVVHLLDAIGTRHAGVGLDDLFGVGVFACYVVDLTLCFQLFFDALNVFVRLLKEQVRLGVVVA